MMSKMINNVAYIINEISTITGHPPVKKALQKTVFLLETKGVNLGFDYILHFYGPYCAELDHETARLSADGVVQFDYEKYGHKMMVNPECISSIETNLSEDSLHLAQEVITRYKERTAADLELLTTAIYAYEYAGAKTQTDVIEKIKIIKGKKYNDQEILWALSEFPYFNITL